MDGRRPAQAGAQNPAYRPTRPPPGRWTAVPHSRGASVPPLFRQGWSQGLVNGSTPEVLGVLEQVPVRRGVEVPEVVEAGSEGHHVRRIGALVSASSLAHVSIPWRLAAVRATATADRVCARWISCSRAASLEM